MSVHAAGASHGHDIIIYYNNIIMTWGCALREWWSDATAATSSTGIGIVMHLTISLHEVIMHSACMCESVRGVYGL